MRTTWRNLAPGPDALRGNERHPIFRRQLRDAAMSLDVGSTWETSGDGEPRARGTAGADRRRSSDVTPDQVQQVTTELYCERMEFQLGSNPA